MKKKKKSKQIYTLDYVLKKPIKKIFSIIQCTLDNNSIKLLRNQNNLIKLVKKYAKKICITLRSNYTLCYNTTQKYDSDGIKKNK